MKIVRRALPLGLGIGLLLGLGVGVGGAAASWQMGLTSFEAASLLSPQDVAAPLVDELYRRSRAAVFPLPPAVGGTGWTTLGLTADAAGPFHGSSPSAAGRLARWLERPTASRRPTLGLSLRPELTLVGLSTDPRRQLRPSYLDVRSGDAVDPNVRALFTLRADARLLASLSAHMRFTLDSDARNNPLRRTADLDPLGASNDLDEAYLRWHGRHVAVLFGRAPLAWGPEPLGPLALSATAPALDLAYASLRWGRQRLGMFAGQLSSETVTTADGRATRAKRYLYGHRLDLFFGRWRLGLDELALAAGPGESLSLRYLNPLQIYAQLQAEDNGDDPSQVNVLTSFDSDVRLGPVRLFGSFLLDDLQIDAEGRDRKPDQLGWSVGAGFGPTVSSPWWVGYVYRRLDTWTFLHGDDGTSLRQFERPLGAPEGPDGDRHHLHVSRRLSSRWRLSLEGEHRRRGENRITTGDTASGHAGEPFPSGRVESRWIASAGLQASLPPFAEAFLTASYHDIKNVNNTSSDENVLEVRLEMRLRGPAVSWRIREEDAD